MDLLQLEHELVLRLLKTALLALLQLHFAVYHEKVLLLLLLFLLLLGGAFFHAHHFWRTRFVLLWIRLALFHKLRLRWRGLYYLGRFCVSLLLVEAYSFIRDNFFDAIAFLACLMNLLLRLVVEHLTHYFDDLLLRKQRLLLLLVQQQLFVVWRPIDPEVLQLQNLALQLLVLLHLVLRVIGVHLHLLQTNAARVRPLLYL